MTAELKVRSSGVLLGRAQGLHAGGEGSKQDPAEGEAELPGPGQRGFHTATQPGMGASHPGEGGVNWGKMVLVKGRQIIGRDSIRSCWQSTLGRAEGRGLSPGGHSG